MPVHAFCLALFHCQFFQEIFYKMSLESTSIHAIISTYISFFKLIINLLLLFLVFSDILLYRLISDNKQDNYGVFK